MLTATTSISYLIGRMLESDPVTEIELRDAGYPNVEVRHDRATDTLLVSIDRTALRELIADARRSSLGDGREWCPICDAPDVGI